MAEITFDEDTRIVEMNEADNCGNSSKQISPEDISKAQRPRSVVVRVPLERITEASTSNVPEISSKRKKELLAKAQQISQKMEKDKAARIYEKNQDFVSSVPSPHPVPENYNIPKLDKGKD